MIEPNELYREGFVERLVGTTVNDFEQGDTIRVTVRGDVPNAAYRVETIRGPGNRNGL